MLGRLLFTPWTPRRFFWMAIALPAIFIMLWLLAMPVLFGITLLLAFSGSASATIGLAYIIYGLSLIPASAYNLLISAFIVSFLPTNAARYLAFVPVSLSLALSVEAPVIWQRIFHPPEIEESITRSIQLDSTAYVWISPRFGERHPVANPLESEIGIGSDEGCMCIYWSAADRYGKLISDDVLHIIGKQPVGKHFVYVNVTGQSNKADDRLMDLAIQVRDGNDTTAELIERGVPQIQNLGKRAQRGELFNRYFLQNLVHVLSHDTFWTPIMDRFLDFYPRAAIRRFLEAAIKPAG